MIIGLSAYLGNSEWSVYNTPFNFACPSCEMRGLRVTSQDEWHGLRDVHPNPGPPKCSATVAPRQSQIC